MDFYDTVTTVTVGEGLTIVSVAADGTPFAEDYYSYDSASGELTIAQSPTSVQSVSVTVDKESSGLLSSLVSAISNAFTETVYALSSWDEMSYFARNIDIGSMSVGDYFDAQVGYSYSGSYKYSSTVYGAKAESDTICAELIKAVQNGGSDMNIDVSHIASLSSAIYTCSAIQLNTSSVQSKNAGLGSITTTMVLECAHIDTDLGKASNSATEVTARIRLLATGTDSAGTSYAVFGIITQMTHTQSSVGIFKVGIVKNGWAYVQKVSSDATKVANNSNYSLAGAKYQIFKTYEEAEAAQTGSDSNNTARIATLTTDSTGKTQTIELEPDTYYVKEIVASKGYKLDKAIHEVVVENGKTTTVPSTETYDTGSLKVIKYSDNTGVTSGNDNYTLLGATFAVYSDASFSTYVDDVVIDSYDSSGGYYYGTLDGLLFGTYYIKESTAPEYGYAIDEKERSATVSVSGGQTSFWDRPITITVNVIKSADTSSIVLDDTTFSVESLMDGDSYSLEGAVYGLYSAEACTEDVEIARATTDADGNATFDVENLAMGTYYVKEIYAPEGYDLDEETYTVNATKDSGDLYTVSSTNKAIDISSEDPITGGKIAVYKSSEEPALLELYSEYYSLKDAVYGVYPTIECAEKQLLAKITTDETGYGITETTLPYGTYYVKEITASQHHDLDTTGGPYGKGIYPVTLSSEAEEVAVESVEPVLYKTLYVAKGAFSMLETGTAFDADIPASAKYVVFTETANIPDGYTIANGKLTDVSYSQDEGIVAWLSGTTWYVAAAEEGQPIYFNYDSSYMFAGSGAGTTTLNTNGHSVVTVDFGDGVINTSFTTDISGMFASAYSVATIKGLDQFDTSNVTDMSYVFHHAYRLYGTIDLSSWDTSNVTTMSNFMDNCWNVNTLTLGDGWDTSNVTSFYGFVAITSLTNANYQAIVDAIEIDSATEVGMMFAQTSSDDLEQYGKTYIGSTTISSYLTELDLSGWDLANNTSIANMEQMFRGAVNLTNISGMYIPVNVTSTYNMFNSCYRLGADTMWMMEITVLTTADKFDCRQTFYNTSIFDGANNTNTILRISYSSAAQSHAEEMYATAVTGADLYGDGTDYSAYTNLIELASAATASIESADSSTLLASAASFLSTAASMVRQMVTGVTDGSLLASVREMFAPVEAVAADSDETSVRNAVYNAYENKECTKYYGQFEYSYSLYDDNGNETAMYILENVPYGCALWVKEVKPSSGYGLDQDVHEFTEDDPDGATVESIEPPTDDPYEATITLYKKFSDTVNENYSLKGIQYWIYTDSSCKSGTELYVDGTQAILELTEGGISNTVTITGLEKGKEYTYYIKEQEPDSSTGAEWDTKTYSVTLVAGSSEAIQVLNTEDKPKYGELEVTKSSADTTITSGNDSYSYVGATFGIYTDEDCTSLWGTMTTGDNYKASTGKIVPLGTYYIKETEAPAGFERDTETVYKAVVYLDDNGDPQTAYYTWDDAAGTWKELGDELIFEDQPYTGTIEIKKYSADTSVTDGNNNYSLEGAKFAIYESDGTTLYTTLTTDAKGYASVTDVPLGTYYVKETEASKGYKINSATNKVVLTTAGASDGKTYLVSVPETPIGVTITLVKSSADPDATDGNENYTLEGAKFGVYTDESCSDESLVDTLTTDADGYCESKALASGTYYIKEIQAPEGYVIDETVYKVEAADDGSLTYTNMTTGESGSSLLVDNSLSVVETPETVKFRVYKESAYRDLTDHLDTYSLEGAVYGVYTSEEDANNDVVDENGEGTLGAGYITTDEDGVTEYLENLPYGTYYVKETKAPDGYEMDETVYTVELTYENADADYAVELAVSDVPDYGGDLIIYKLAIPADGLSEFVFPENTVEGAQFMVQYYDAQYSSVEEIEEAKAAPTRIWYINVVSDGNGGYYASLSEECLQADISDELYYDKDGNVIIPIGTVTVQECTSATGYTLDGSWYDSEGVEILECDEDGNAILYDEDGNVTEDESGTTQSVEIVLFNVTQDSDTETVTFTKEDKEDVPPCSVTLLKKDSEGQLLLGVTFTLYMYDEDLEEWVTVGEATTDEEGKAVFEELRYGYSYRIVETSTVDGMTILAEPIEFDLPMPVDVDTVESMSGVDMSTAYLSSDEMYYLFCDVTYTVTNNAEFRIPEAGVSAALPALLGVGIAIVALGAFLVIRRRRTVR